MLPQKILKIRMICLTENECRATKFPDFFLFVSEFPDISRLSRFSKSLDTLMTTVKLSFVSFLHATVNVYQISKKLLIQITEIWQISYKLVTNH